MDRHENKRDMNGSNREPDRLVAHLPDCLKPRHRDDLVRLGSKHDGGYVVTESIIRHTDFVVGLGVGTNWKFEEDFYRLKKCPVHCYDHTISLGLFTMGSVRYTLDLLRPSRISNIRSFYDPVNLLPLKYSAFFRGKIRHFRERIGGGSESETDFKKIFSRIPDGDRVFIKIDIEGAEHHALSGLGDFQERITGLVIEFHHMIFLHDSVLKIISGIKEFFDIVHVHVNNHKGVDEGGMPDVIEVTFENKNLRRGDDAESGRRYPVEGLDSPNYVVYADFRLVFEPEPANNRIRISSS